MKDPLGVSPKKGNQRTIVGQHCWTQHIARIWPTCCEVLRRVGCCWLKFENDQSFHATFVDVGGRRGGLMVGALDSGASGPGSSPGRGH